MSRILQTLGQLRKGKMLEDLDATLRHVVDAVRDAAQESGGIAGGEVTIKLKLKSQKGDHMVIDVHDEITSKTPARPGGRTVFFASGDGELVRNDPRQQEMALVREVTATVPA